MNASAGGGTATALNSRRRSKGQSFAILLACLGFHCLFTNVNPSYLRQFQPLYSDSEAEKYTVSEANTNTIQLPALYKTYGTIGANTTLEICTLNLISRLQALGMPYWDMRMIYSRSDGHVSSQTNNADCLHFCHGPLDVMGWLFHQLLSSL